MVTINPFLDCLPTKSTISENSLTDKTLIGQFTIGIEENDGIPLLDCLVICDNNKLRAQAVYRKPTHKKRPLHQIIFQPYFPQSNDYTDLRRARLVGDSPSSFAVSSKYFEDVLNVLLITRSL